MLSTNFPGGRPERAHVHCSTRDLAIAEIGARSRALVALVALAAPGCFDNSACGRGVLICAYPEDGGFDADDAPPDSPDAHVLCDGSCRAPTPACLVPGEACVGCVHDGDCSDRAPRCDTTVHECVCRTDSDCHSLPTMARCDATTRACAPCVDDSSCASWYEANYCDVARGTCVRCTSDVGCDYFDQARCTADHTCAPCDTDDNCAHLRSACSAGRCVTCTSTNETACGAYSCYAPTHTCSTTLAGSIPTLAHCFADSECADPIARCVPVFLDGGPRGNYCLTPASAGCTSPYVVPTPMRASVSGAAPDRYCCVDEMATTFEAVADLIARRGCGTRSDCSGPPDGDAVCGTVLGMPSRCSYACTASDQCPAGYDCGVAGYCGSS